jgi:hypothetical protein
MHPEYNAISINYICIRAKRHFLAKINNCYFMENIIKNTIHNYGYSEVLISFRDGPYLSL